jgi:hypothetical protein
VENTYGKGSAILFGSLVFAHQENRSALLELISDHMGYGVDVQPRIFARTLTTEEQRVLILVNDRKASVNVKVRIKGTDFSRVPQEIWQRKKVLLKKNRAVLKLEPLESAVLLL